MNTSLHNRLDLAHVGYNMKQKLTKGTENTDQQQHHITIHRSTQQNCGAHLMGAVSSCDDYLRDHWVAKMNIGLEREYKGECFGGGGMQS
eukprot:scaffold28063_cov52-Attheya_sp.AAC.1